jgi:hypothetical protein
LEPSKEKIDQLKALYPERQLILVEALDGEEQVMHFVMTAPERGEYKIFLEKFMKASESTGSNADKLWAKRAALEEGALAQIRWPSREECMEAFRKRPAMVDGFMDEMQKAAGEQIEFRSKKL